MGHEPRNDGFTQAVAPVFGEDSNVDDLEEGSAVADDAPHADGLAIAPGDDAEPGPLQPSSGGHKGAVSEPAHGANVDVFLGSCDALDDVIRSGAHPASIRVITDR